MSHKEEDEWVPLTAVRLLNLYSRRIVLSVNNNQDILFSLSVCSYEWEQTELLFEHQWLMQSYHPQHVCVCVWSCFPTFVGTQTERAPHHVRSDNFMGTKMLHHEMNSLHFRVNTWITVRQIVINICKVSVSLHPQVMKTCVQTCLSLIMGTYISLHSHVVGTCHLSGDKTQEINGYFWEDLRMVNVM